MNDDPTPTPPADVAPETAETTTPPPDAATPSRRPAIARAIEWLLMVCLLVAGGLTFLAGPRPDDQAWFSQPYGQFYREVLMGRVERGETVVDVPYMALLAGLGIVLFVLALTPAVAPPVRGALSAFAFILVLAPVINYGPQRDLLLIPPEMRLEGSPTGEAFYPLLPVSWPLIVGLALLVVWLLATPWRDWPDTVKAFGFVVLVFCLRGWVINELILRARGQALDLVHLQWPYAMESLWTLAHLGVAAVLAAAAARGALPSRVLAGLAALLLFAVAALGGLP